MSQNFNKLLGSSIIKNDRATINENFDAIRSAHSGTSFPSKELVAGMLFFNTSTKKLYELNSDGSTWVLIFDLSSGTAVAPKASVAESSNKATGDKNGKNLTSYVAKLEQDANDKFIIRVYDGADALMTTIAIPEATVMTGASSSSVGKSGLVPAPKAGDENKFLCGDGTWKAVQAFIDFIYPVGSLYWSKKATNPSTLFGGTWTRVKDKFILAAGDTYAQGATGGAATVALTTAQMPAHTHTASSNSTGAHTHSIQQCSYSGRDTAMNNAVGQSYNNNTIKTASAAILSAGSHSHTITVNSAGSGEAHENMPPYVTYYCWERTA